ncbi:MAG: hypothetical protein QOG66_608 [Methylobacteriaceae bacterium]|jgi:hypothetical protein|nr:hypothetical protein [Methylobacteriaceae bacterium]
MPDSALRQRLHRWVAGNAEAQVLRWLLRVLLIATVSVLALDLSAMTGFKPESLWREVTEQPVLPDMAPTTTDVPVTPDGGRRVVPARKADGALAKPMTFSLGKNGRLIATGMIAQGSAGAFAAEVNARGEYIKTVVLNSPGGSVGDALEIGRLIRAKGFATEVEKDKICVSSCPLVFVGGVKRTAGANAIIGVHQVFAPDPAEAARHDTMSEAQRVSARCQRYLGEMGIDLKMWVHAMETPKDRLFIFPANELRELSIVTPTNVAANGEASDTRR